MRSAGTVHLRRPPTRAEARHIVEGIWGLGPDYAMMRRNGYTDRYYDDVIRCLRGEAHPESFAAAWGFGDGSQKDVLLEYWTMDVWFETIKYLYLKGMVHMRK